MASLLQGLEASSSSKVLSCCQVLVLACTRHGWIPHALLIPEMASQATTASCYPIILDGVTDLLVYEMSMHTGTSYSLRWVLLSLLLARPSAHHLYIPYPLSQLLFSLPLPHLLRHLLLPTSSSSPPFSFSFLPPLHFFLLTSLPHDLLHWLPQTQRASIHLPSSSSA